MSSNWPALLQGNLTSGLPVEKHRHDANDISGNLGDVLVGDIRSFNWNGGSDLSGGADPTGTQGYFFDASAGAIQAQVLYWPIGAATAHPAAAALTVSAPLADPGERWDIPAVAAPLALSAPQATVYCSGVVSPAAAAVTVTAPQATPGTNEIVVRSYSSGAASYSSGWRITAPATISAGDTLLCLIAQTGGPNLTAAAGWTLLPGGMKWAPYLTCGVYWHKADGTEDGQVLTVCTSDDTAGHTANHICYALGAADPAVTPPNDHSVYNYNLSANPNPPHNEQVAGLYRWFAFYGSEAARTVTGWPTNYGDSQVNVTTTPSLGACSRLLNTTLENPDAFTISAADYWLSYTVAVAAP